MTREELIDKAAKFMARDSSPDMVMLTLEKFADFALSLQEPESKPWPQEGDEVWFQYGDGSAGCRTYDDDDLDNHYLRQGRIHRTEAEAIRANEVEAANAEIKRWRDENAPFVAVNWKSVSQRKYYGVYRHDDERWGGTWTAIGEPVGVIIFASHDDLARCQAEIPDAWAALVGVK